MASTDGIPHSSSVKLLQATAAERRKKVFLGEMPMDFLRIAIQPLTTSQYQQHQQQQLNRHQQPVVPVYITDPNLIVKQNLLQAQHTFYSFIPPNTRGRLSITIVEAKLVKNYGLIRMDPYCRVRVGSAVFETPTNISGGKAPRWNRIINAYLPHGVESFYLQIFDERAFTVDECIAWAHIVLPNGVFNGEVIDDWYQLTGQQGEGKEGVINLITSFTPVESTSPQSSAKVIQAQQQTDGRIRYSEAPYTKEEVNELHAMFPSLEVDVIEYILEEKRGNKDATVTAILDLTAEQ